MTMGSPVASEASLPGVEEMNASCLPSGDQVNSLPVPGRGLLVPFVDARKVMSEPSACAANSPDLSAMLPSKASIFPSGDHTGRKDARFRRKHRRSEEHTSELQSR